MSSEVAILAFGRHNQAWRQQVLQSPPAQRAREEGVVLEPDWANGAKILVPRVSAADLIRSRVELRPFHVILLKQDVNELEEWLRTKLSYRQRPRADEQETDAPIQQFDYTVEKTFVCTSASQGRSLSTVTASTQGYGARNPRQWRPSLPSDATDGSQHPVSKKTLWEHAGEMKKWQGVRNIHQVLQCFANIKRDGLIPDTYCYNIIINLFGKLGQLEESERWFQQMESDGIGADANSFAVLMDAYGIDMQVEKVEWCMAEMERRNLIPTESHVSILIKAYARQANSGGENQRKQASEAAEAVFQDLVTRGEKPALLTFGAMIDMYAQQGKPTEAEEMLTKKLEHMPMGKVDCCMMMNAHANAVCGEPEDRVHVDEAMRWQGKLKADFGFSSIRVYDYTVLLKACARSKPKQVDLACRLFREQVQAGIQPDHFNIQTLHSVGGGQNAKINQVIEEMGIDTEKLKEDFQADGDEYNYDEKLNRKLWKLKIETDEGD